MAIDKTLIDQLPADCKKPEHIIGKNGCLKNSPSSAGRALQAELTSNRGGAGRGQNLAEQSAGGGISHWP